MQAKIADIPEDSGSASSPSSAGSPGQSSSSSYSAHSGRSAWPWHKAGLTHGWGLVATHAPCLSETVVLNEKGISRVIPTDVIQWDAYSCATTCGISSECHDIFPGGMVAVCGVKNWSCSGDPTSLNITYPPLGSTVVGRLVFGFGNKHHNRTGTKK